MIRALIITPFYPPNIGGMERAVERLAIALTRVGVVVDIHTSRIGSNPGGYQYRPTENLTVVRSGESLAEWGVMARDWAKSGTPDVVIVTSFGPDYFSSMIEICRNMRGRDIRVVWRTPTSDHAKRNIAPASMDVSILLDAIVANSHASARQTEEVLGMPVETIPNLLLSEEIAAAHADSQGERLAAVSWIGRVAARKNPMALALVLNQLSRDYEVCIQATPAYGEHNLFDNFMTAISPRIIVAAPSLEPPLAARRAATFLHLSEVEGSPNAVLEACSRGIFPIVKDIPACAELLEGLQSALVGQSSDPIEPLVRQLIRASTPESREFQHNIVAQRHGERAIAERWKEVLFA